MQATVECVNLETLRRKTVAVCPSYNDAKGIVNHLNALNNYARVSGKVVKAFYQVVFKG